ncbi:MAG: VOC family protein [Balneolaceae bacterium]|nr:VOC family protein [Balneolaceae bacterium]
MSGHLFFEIQADNMQRAVKFYQHVFEWNFFEHESKDDIHVEYMRIETGGTAGGLLKRPSETPPPECGTNAFVCSFEVVNVDSISEKILNAGGKMVMAKFAVPGVCWQGYFADTEGNTFGLFQVDENAK